MQNVLENTGDAAAMPQQHPGLVSRIFRDYRNNFGLLWRVMLPVIIVNLLLYMAIFLFSESLSPGRQWTISTEIGLLAHSLYSQSAQPTGIVSGINFDISSAHIGLLWLTMCPLAFIIVQRRNGIDSTFKAIWQRALRKTVPILGIAFFIGILMPSFPGLLFLVSETLLEKLIPSHASTLFGISAWIAFAWFLFIGYCVVKWSLYNQVIMIENLSAIGAILRSSELVRGKTWWRFCGIYLLLIYGATVLTSLLLALTTVLLSFAVPEFIPMREILLPERFISLFFFGYAQITLENAPNFWTIAAMVSVYTLVQALLTPIWASLTTQLYMERAGGDTQQVSA